VDVKNAPSGSFSRSGSFTRRDEKARRRAILARLARSAGDEPLRVFCSGIGGTGLSGLAALARSLGHEVAGSDLKKSPATEALEAKGIRVVLEQKGENLSAETDLLVATAALPANHPELQAAVARGIAVVKYAEALGAFVLARRGIAVSGTHGKSTTTALTAHILREAGRKPTWIVGGQVPQLGGSSELGDGPDIVIEACEFDRSFLNYVPSTAIVLNVEEDHLDCYGGGLEEIVEAFVAFGTGLRENGTLVVSADWPSALRVGDLVKAARPDVLVVTFSQEREAHVRAEDVRFDGGFASFELVLSGERKGRVELGIPGEHNVANALAAIAAVTRAGVDPEEALRAIPTFRGVARRFEVLARDPIFVVDDYAHHPTAIEAVLEAARRRFGGRRLVCCFEPHQANRTRHLFAEFARALALADRVVLADIYVCRDKQEDVSAVSADDLARAVREINPETRALHARGREGVLAAARAIARPGDAVLFLGAGNLATSCAHAFAEAVAKTSLPTEIVQRGAISAAASSLQLVRPRLAPDTRTDLDRSLERALGGMLTRRASLADRVSFRAGGGARFLVEPRTAEEAEHAFLTLRARGVPIFVLGGGSNTLAKDGIWDGAVVATRGLRGVTIEGTSVRALAGTGLQRVAHRAQESGLSGLELFAGIPGTIGGAVAGNAGGPRGAGTVGERARRVHVVDREGRVRWLERDALGLRYRGSDLEGTLVLEVELELRPDASELVRARHVEAARTKARHQPLAARSAGCIFRNPEGDSAGRLIDALGLKNLARGAARVSEKHANFIVNDGGARAEEILELVEEVRARVRAASGHGLDLELKVLGES
jgi:UDP-N-acetylmuramate--L-alanine ligase/UDP-N-acetylenolpyruvoylglucosamine reductase